MELLFTSLLYVADIVTSRRGECLKRLGTIYVTVCASCGKLIDVRAVTYCTPLF